MKTTIDQYSGKPFRYNDTITYMGFVVPCRITKTECIQLAPDRVERKLLAELNEGLRKCHYCGAGILPTEPAWSINGGAELECGACRYKGD